MDFELILEPDCSPAQVAELAVAAEQRGFRTLWTSNYHNKWDAFLALVPAAQATSRIRLGVLAISLFDDPMQGLEMIAERVMPAFSQA